MMMTHRRVSLVAVGVAACSILMVAPLAASPSESSFAVTTNACEDSSTPRCQVGSQLSQLGLSPTEVEARLNALTDEDLVKLSEQPGQLAMGGVQDKTLITIALILIVPSILLLIAI